MRIAPGPTRYALQRTDDSTMSAMKLFITDKMLEIILQETNREMERVFVTKGKTYKPISSIELEAFLGMYDLHIFVTIAVLCLLLTASHHNQQ